MSKKDIVQKNLEFVYGKPKEQALPDPDKVAYVKSTKKDFVDPDAIYWFEGDNEFLHPAYKCEVCFLPDTKPYPSFEHALLASKFKSPEKRDEVRTTELVRDVKRMVSREKNSSETLYVDWNDRCATIAEVLLRDKFIRNKELKAKILATSRKSLYFMNDYKDVYWGLDMDRKGQNKLGKLIEKVREDIIKGEDIDEWIHSNFSFHDLSKLRVSIEVLKNGGKIEGDSKEFTGMPKIFIGKADICELVALHPSLSRCHAVLVADKAKNQLVLVDLHSANGTYVNSKQMPPYMPYALQENETFRCGTSAREYKCSLFFDADIIKREQLIAKMSDPSVLEKSSTDSENTVFVRGLPAEATDRDIEDFFAPCGTITVLSVPRDRRTQESKGIAFVTFSSFSAVIQALSRDGDKMLNRYIKVKKSDAGKAPTTNQYADSKTKKESKSRGPPEKNYYGPQDGSNPKPSENLLRDRSCSRDRSNRQPPVRPNPSENRSSYGRQDRNYDKIKGDRRSFSRDRNVRSGYSSDHYLHKDSARRRRDSSSSSNSSSSSSSFSSSSGSSSSSRSESSKGSGSSSDSDSSSSTHSRSPSPRRRSPPREISRKKISNSLDRDSRSPPRRRIEKAVERRVRRVDSRSRSRGSERRYRGSDHRTKSPNRKVSHKEVKRSGRSDSDDSHPRRRTATRVTERVRDNQNSTHNMEEALSSTSANDDNPRGNDSDDSGPPRRKRRMSPKQ